MMAGLRIDVDTLRGTRDGVPRLCQILKKHGLRASFFFSVGPDNMGRNLWRLLRPAFLVKMLRTRASRLYGWDILLRGTFFPGPVIGERCAKMICATRDAGHELGLHAWDHHKWQTSVERMDRAVVKRELRRAFDLMSSMGCSPSCSAAPAWKCTDGVLLEKEGFPFRYNSDCRGAAVFRPRVGDEELRQPQVPVTLPTYDELIGGGVGDAEYNETLLARFSTHGLNVLTVHAEVEGIACAGMFDSFLNGAAARGLTFIPLGELPELNGEIEVDDLHRGSIPGRDGWCTFQGEI